MMKLFVSYHVVLLILVVTTTIDASRLFYLPLPKIHPTHQQEQIKTIDETTKKPISDEYIPESVLEQEEIESKFFLCSIIESLFICLLIFSAINRFLFYFFFYSERGDNFNWEDLIDQEAAKRRSYFDDIPSGRIRHRFVH